MRADESDDTRQFRATATVQRRQASDFLRSPLMELAAVPCGTMVLHHYE